MDVPLILLPSECLHSKQLVLRNDITSFSSHAIQITPTSAETPVQSTQPLPNGSSTQTKNDDLIYSNSVVAQPPNPTLAICHKDQASFYKSSRKSCRTATRLWREFQNCQSLSSNVESSSLGKSDGSSVSIEGCWISPHVKENERDQKQSPQQHQIEQIQKRLVQEFGPQQQSQTLQIKTDRGSAELRLKLTNFGPDSCTSSDQQRGNSFIEVIYLDLDALFAELDKKSIEISEKSTSSQLSSSNAVRESYILLNTILFQLSQMRNSKLSNNFLSIFHVKSECLYRGIPAISKNGDEVGITGKDCFHLLESSDLSTAISEDGTTGGNSTSREPSISSNGVIRRLRHKKGAANCPLSLYPARYVEADLKGLMACGSTLSETPMLTKMEDGAVKSSSPGYASSKLVEICRFYNYDSERGCLRSKKKHGGCDLDHEHCHACGHFGHRAFECAQHTNLNHSTNHFPHENDATQSSVVFRKNKDGRITSIPFLNSHPMINLDSKSNSHEQTQNHSLPSLLVLGGRLRGRTLANSEALPLSGNVSHKLWCALPNLLEHRGSHAAVSPKGTGLVFVLGGGGVDGNLDTVEILDFGGKFQKLALQGKSYANDTDVPTSVVYKRESRWKTMGGRLSSPRHAFGAVACVTEKGQIGQHGDRVLSFALFAVGGWKYGSVSCENMERLDFEFILNKDEISDKPWLDMNRLQNDTQWNLCAPLLLPRRLHSVVSSASGEAIFVFGGYVDERRTTNSIEKYIVETNTWMKCESLPYGENNCPLIQAVVHWTQDGKDSFLIFPYCDGDTGKSSSCKNGTSSEEYKHFESGSVLRYTPGAENPFSHILIKSSKKNLQMPISSWSSFSATSSASLKKAYLIGGTIDGKWTRRGFELDLVSMEWNEMPELSCARRRLACVVVE